MIVRRAFVHLVRQGQVGVVRCSSSSSASTAQTREKKSPVSYHIPEKMKAWNLNSYSGLAGLEYNTESPVPTIKQGTDLLIQVKAASVNPLDVLMSSGYGYSLFELMQSRTIENFSTFRPFPIVLGRDFSGVVVDKGMDTQEFQIGDQVWGSVWPSSQGSHAEYVVASKISISRKPERLNHTEAASIPYAALTGWAAIVTTGNLTSYSSPQKVLVVGAAGGVGTFAVQLLKAWNHEVTAVCRSDALPLLESLGADRVLDYTQPDFNKDLEKAGAFDLVLDLSGGSNDAAYLTHLRRNCGSKYVSTSSPLLKAMDKKGILFGTFDSALELINKNLNSLRDKSATYRWAYYAPNPTALNEIAKLVDQEKIRPTIEKVYAASDLKEAFEKLSQGSARGKLVIEF